MNIKVSKITLLYTCPECGATASQPLCDITEVGTATCSECDCDMLLDDDVEIEDE